jgi:hypothetical protein
MMRQVLEFQPRRARRRIFVVGQKIAPPDFGRIHADLRRRQFDQPLGHGRGDRMADGAVLAHHVFVLKHDAGASAVVRTGVRTADQIDDLVSLDPAGARIDRIRPDPGQIVDRESRDRTVAPDADLGVDAMIAGVDVGDEAFQPVGDEFDRPLEQF